MIAALSEREQLLGVLCLLYVVECLRWVRKGGVVFSGWPKARHARRSPFARNDTGDLHLAWPLPPFDRFFVARGLPFSFAHQGALTFNAASFHPDGRPVQPAVFIPWTDVAHLHQEGPRLRLGNRLAWKADTSIEARRLMDLLRQGAATPPDLRKEWLERTAAALFDTESARARLQADAILLGPIRHAATALWILLFALIPLGVWLDGWMRPLAVGLPAVFGLSAWISRRSTRIHLQWFPSAKDERFQFALLVGLSPITAIRASDLLTRSRMEEFHPATLAALLLPDDQSAAFAAEAWRDLQNPRLPFPALGPREQEAESDWRGLVRSEFARWARNRKLDPGVWEAPPRPTEPSHRRYCPRCLAQSTAQAVHCVECGGIPLRDLTTDSRSPLTNRVEA